MSSSTSIERTPYAVAPSSIRVSAVMPRLNEDRTVGVCIEKAFAALRGMGINDEVVVVDNGSSDQSVERATALGIKWPKR
jgi:glycosyltransferase involved in cell wall biosynthesis